MDIKKIVVSFSVLLLLSGCQVKPQQEPLQKLTGAEVKDLFVDNTVESFNVISGNTSFTFYHNNGQVFQERYWEKRSGHWKVNSQGDMCLSLEGKEFRCRGIYRKDYKYYKYRLDDGGQLEKVIRYRQFINGNVLTNK